MSDELCYHRLLGWKQNRGLILDLTSIEIRVVFILVGLKQEYIEIDRLICDVNKPKNL